MKFENTKTYNFDGAFRGMRNPMNSWHLSDSFFGLVNTETTDADYIIAEKWVQKDYPNFPMESNPKAEKLYETTDDWLFVNGVLECDEYNLVANCAFIGPNDMDLAQRLIKGGPEHRKFLRQITVCVDITAPLYWWKEFDTYKVGTTANSTSTMHKLATTPITLDCFEIDDYNERLNISSTDIYKSVGHCVEDKNGIIEFLETLRLKYLETKDVRYWKELIRWLPESWLQTRTVTMTYENIYNMRHQREGHKLTEWRISFMDWAKTLPYAEDFIFDNFKK